MFLFHGAKVQQKSKINKRTCFFMYSAGTFFAHTDYETLQGGRIKMRPPCRQLYTLWQHTSPIFFLYQAVADIFFFSDLYLLHIFEVFYAFSVIIST